jgi:hypothetical protein
MPVQQLPFRGHANRRSTVTRQSTDTPAERSTLHYITPKKENRNVARLQHELSKVLTQNDLKQELKEHSEAMQM